MTKFDFTALRLARKSANLTQAYVAKSIGCSPYTLTSWENGQTSIPAEKLNDLMNLYGTSITEFFISKPKGDQL